MEPSSVNVQMDEILALVDLTDISTTGNLLGLHTLDRTALIYLRTNGYLTYSRTVNQCAPKFVSKVLLATSVFQIVKLLRASGDSIKSFQNIEEEFVTWFQNLYPKGITDALKSALEASPELQEKVKKDVVHARSIAFGNTLKSSISREPETSTSANNKEELIEFFIKGSVPQEYEDEIRKMLKIITDKSFI